MKEYIKSGNGEHYSVDSLAYKVVNQKVIINFGRIDNTIETTKTELQMILDWWNGEKVSMENAPSISLSKGPSEPELLPEDQYIADRFKIID